MKTKFIFMFCLISFLQNNLNAQIRKDNIIVGGDVGFTSVNNGSYFGIAPEVGYLFDETFEAGLGIGYTLITQGIAKRNLWNFSPYVNYFFSDSFYLRAKYQYLIGHETGTSASSMNINESAMWLGAGYQSINDHFIYRTGILYNAIYNQNTSIYNSPILPFASFAYRL